MSAESDASSAALSGAVSGPRRVSSDAGEVEQQPLQDLIDADKYLASKDAAKSKRQGIRFTKLAPDGTL